MQHSNMWFTDSCTFLAIVRCGKFSKFFSAKVLWLFQCTSSVLLQFPGEAGRRVPTTTTTTLERESPATFTSLLMRAVREQDPWNRAACESTEAPRRLQMWSTYRYKKSGKVGKKYECMWISNWKEVFAFKKNIKGPFARETGRGLIWQN